jgi:hypothetical protein
MAKHGFVIKQLQIDGPTRTNRKNAKFNLDQPWKLMVHQNWTWSLLKMVLIIKNIQTITETIPISQNHHTPLAKSTRIHTIIITSLHKTAAAAKK